LLLAPVVAAATAPAPGASQWVDARFDLSQPDLRHLAFAGALAVHLIPVDGKPTTARDLVRAYDAGSPSERADLLGKLTTSAQSDLKGSLEAAFPHANVTVGAAVVDQATLANTPRRVVYDQLNMTLSAQIVRDADDPALQGVTDEQLAAVFEVGAQVRSTFSLTSQAGYDTIYTLHAPAAPAALAFASPSAGSLSADGKAWTISIENAQGSAARSQGVSATLGSTDAPVFHAQKADLGVVVDLQSLDVTLGKAVKGDFGTLHVQVTVTGQLNVLAIPASFKARLGDNVALDYLSADGLRLLKKSGLLTADNVTSIETDLRARLADNLKSALGQDVDVAGGIDPATLDPALISTPPSGDKPVTFTAHAAFTKPLSGSSSSGAAIALYTVHQAFDFPKVQSLDTSYTVILPKGLAVAGLDVTGGTGTQGKAADGRDQFVVT